MSEIKVNSIKGVAASSAAISINNTDGTCTANITSVNGGQLSNRNLLINGDMQISQRNGTSSVAVVNNSFTVDRWQAVNDAGSSKFSVQQVTDAPVGFYNSLKMTSTSAYTIPSNEVYGIGQKIEGLNTNWLEFGSSDAKTITISFFVKSSLTGTFGGSVLNSDMTRGFPWTYTISSADTWERKTVTVSGSPDGTWSTNNGTGIRVHWSMGANANRSGTAGQWSTAQYTFHPTGATNVVSTNGATLQITGCQVEEGSVATDFEHRSYAQELASCQRYYHELDATNWFNLIEKGSTYRRLRYEFPVTMRATPTVSNAAGTNNGSNGSPSGTQHGSTKKITFHWDSPGLVYLNTAEFSAEL
tara:strand:+ start:710 stop:1786 length:1077 start_codon:yes stop_codon:yes gene_type:complete